MIKLKKILTTIHDPFTGELYEGLINSVDIVTAIKHLKNANYEIDSWNKNNNEIVIKIIPWYAPDILQRYTSGNIYDENISKLLKLINALGYMATYIRYYTHDLKLIGLKYTSSELRRIYNEIVPNIIFLKINKKFDDVINIADLKGDVIYHLTKKEFVSKIKSIGLKPASKEKLKFHPPRVYFSTDIRGIYTLMKHKKYEGYSICITVDIDKKNDITFFKDPDFEMFGIYTYDNIPKESIIKIENVKLD